MSAVEAHFAELAMLTPLLVTLQRLQQAMLDTDLEWVLPYLLLPDASRIYGLPVTHAPVPVPMLAHRTPPQATDSPLSAP
jgi:hypothetical protein